MDFTENQHITALYHIKSRIAFRLSINNSPTRFFRHLYFQKFSTRLGIRVQNTYF